MVINTREMTRHGISRPHVFYGADLPAARKHAAIAARDHQTRQL